MDDSLEALETEHLTDEYQSSQTEILWNNPRNYIGTIVEVLEIE